VKPDRRLYEILLERYALRAGESLFIDDNAANIETAREFGLSGYSFHRRYESGAMAAG